MFPGSLHKEDGLDSCEFKVVELLFLLREHTLAASVMCQTDEVFQHALSG